MRRSAGLLATLAVVLVSGCGNEAASGPPAPVLSAPSAPAEHPVPTAIRIPSIGVDGRDVAPMALQADGSIQVPPLDRVGQLGYYCPASPGQCGAPMPGEVGPAVLLAHINGKGGAGLFAKLADVKRGDAFEVDRSDGQTVSFRVREVQIVDKDEFPSQKVYGNTVGPEARLITCGPGDLDHVAHNYKQQTIIYADMTQMRPTK
jgi:LPXTG-site transpeptidase (sortase) family protein